jgi:hypothetical protein
VKLPRFRQLSAPRAPAAPCRAAAAVSFGGPGSGEPRPLRKARFSGRRRAGSRQVSAANPCKHWASETFAPRIGRPVADVCFAVVSRSQNRWP